MSSLKKLYLLLVLILLSSIKCQENDTIEQTETISEPKNEINKEEQDWSKPFEEILGYRMRSEGEIEHLLKISDLTFLRFAYRKSSPKSRKIAEHLKYVNQKLEGLAGILLIDCDTFVPETSVICKLNPYMNDSFPRLKLLVPPEKRFDPYTGHTEVHYEFPLNTEDLSENGIYNFITSNMPYYTHLLNNDNIFGFLNSELFNKVILFTNKKQPSTIIKGLTNYFFDSILFGEVDENEKELIDRFKITTFPTLLVYKVFDHKRLLDEHETIKYEGLIKISDLISFIEPHSLKEKRYVSENRHIYEDNLREITKNIEFTEIDKVSYENYFNKYWNKNIFVYFNTQNNLKHIYKQVLIKNQYIFLTLVVFSILFISIVTMKENSVWIGSM
jgi:hypothetical protein